MLLYTLASHEKQLHELVMICRAARAARQEANLWRYVMRGNAAYGEPEVTISYLIELLVPASRRLR